MATKLKVVGDVADAVPAPQVPKSQGAHGSASQRNRPGDGANERSTSVGMDFTPAPTRKRNAGWTAERQRIFIDRLSLTGNAGEACALAGLSSNSAYRLRNKAGAEGFARAWDAALVLATTRAAAIAWDRALRGRVERFYKNGQLAMMRRIPSDYLLTWLLSRLDPLTFGSPAAKAHALAHGDPRDKARAELPRLMASFTDVPPEDCEADENEHIDEWMGEASDGRVDTSD